MAKLTPRELQLVKIYTDAQLNLYRILTEKAARGSPAAFQRSLLAEVNRELARLQRKTVGWVNAQVPEMYREGLVKAEKAPEIQRLIAEKGNDAFVLSKPAFAKLNKAAIETLVGENIAAASVANKGLQANLKGAITQKVATGQTVRQAKTAILETIYQEMGGTKVRVNGRNWDMRKYSELFARTATREATNTAAVNETKAVGSTIMRMSSHFPTCEVCGPLQGRWYSLEEDGEYPYIYDTAWKNGHNTVHPSCRHTFTTVVMALKDEDEIEKAKKFSNRPMDAPGQPQKSIDLYYKGQEQNRTRWRDQQQWERYKERLGPENTPKTLSGFRRMKGADSDNWQQLQLSYRSAGRTRKLVDSNPVKASNKKLDKINAKLNSGFLQDNEAVKHLASKYGASVDDVRFAAATYSVTYPRRKLTMDTIDSILAGKA